MAKFANAFTILMLLVSIASVAQARCQVEDRRVCQDMPGEPPY